MYVPLPGLQSRRCAYETPRSHAHDPESSPHITQTLVKNELRERVVLRVDGGMRSGRDVLVAAALGGDEYGFGTVAMIATGYAALLRPGCICWACCMAGLTPVADQQTCNLLQDVLWWHYICNKERVEGVQQATALSVESIPANPCFLIVVFLCGRCIMARVCHTNNCPVGVASQREELRARFPGAPGDLVNYFHFIAEEVRATAHCLHASASRNSIIADRRPRHR